MSDDKGKAEDTPAAGETGKKEKKPVKIKFEPRKWNAVVLWLVNCCRMSISTAGEDRGLVGEARCKMNSILFAGRTTS